MANLKRYNISAYCHRCGSGEGYSAVVVDYDEDKNGEWVKFEDISSNSKLCEMCKYENEAADMYPCCDCCYCGNDHFTPRT